MEQHLERLKSRVGDFTPAVGDAFDPLSLADVEAIESRISRPLDAVHRELLMTFGASRFDQYLSFTSETPLPASYSKTNMGVVGKFLGKFCVNFPKAKWISILHIMDILDEDLPPDFLPVADVGSGDLYGIRSDGSVWLWIHDAYKGDELHHVCISFPAWLDLMHTRQA